MKRKIKQRQNQLRRQRREGWELDKCKFEGWDDRFSDDIKNHICKVLKYEVRQ